MFKLNRIISSIQRRHSHVGGSGRNMGSWISWNYVGASAVAGAAASTALIFRKELFMSAATTTAAASLDSSKFLDFKLESVKPVSHNSSIYRFALPSQDHVIGMDVASCVLLKADLPVLDAKTGITATSPVVRPYTPISSPDTRGFVDFLIKTYPDGLMSSHLHSLKVGDSISIKGPIQKFKYEANKWPHIGMVAGGTGITPMWQVIERSLSDPTDKTRITLLFANVSPPDVLMKGELDALASKHPDRFKVRYTVDKQADKWTGLTGHVTKEMVSKVGFPTASEEDVTVFVCGPPGFMKAVSGDKAPDRSQGEVDPSSVFGQLGFSKEKVFKF